MFRERVQAAAVALFVLIIAGVVVVLLKNVDRQAAPAKSPSVDPSSDLDSAAGGPVGAVSISSTGGDLVMRIRAGSCATAGGPKLELSSNRGRSFHQILVPQIDDGSGVSAASPKVRAIVSAKATSRLKMTVAAADEKCAIHRYATTDGGGTWTQKPAAVKEWYTDPKTGVLVSPAGPTDPGCSNLVAVAPVSKTVAKVFCANGTVRATADRGVTWADAGQLPDVSAAVFTGPLTGYALVEGSACKSRVYTTLTGGATWTPQGCIIKEFTIPSLTGSDARLVAGGSGGVRLSTDRGTTWRPSKMK